MRVVLVANGRESRVNCVWKKQIGGVFGGTSNKTGLHIAMYKADFAESFSS